METRRLIIALAFGLGLILLYEAVLLPFLDKKMHLQPPAPAQSATPTPAQTQASTQPATTQAAVGGVSASSTQAATTGPTLTAAAPPPPGARVLPATQPALNWAPSILGSAKEKDAHFALQLNVQPLGAGIGSVVLNNFRATARGTEPYTFQEPLSPSRLDTQPLASRSITVNGATYDLAGVMWSLVSSNPTSVTYGADLVQNGTKLLELRRTYTISPRSQPDLGFEIRADYQFINPTGAPETIRTTFNGPVLPPPEGSRGPDRQVVAAYVVDKDTLELQSHPIEEFKASKDNGQVSLTKDKNGHAARWAGAVSNYFAAIVLPLEMSVDGKATKDTSYISDIVAQGYDIDNADVERRQAYLTFTTTDLKLNPKGSVSLPMAVFLGPKATDVPNIGDVLNNSHYSAPPRHYDLLAEIRSSMCGITFCSFQWLANAIQWLLWAIQSVVRDWGLAIIGLVAIVRILLHPITRSSQISMAKMGKMGPEMKRLQEKYKDDKDALNKAMMEFHREQGLGPYLGCLPMFLQMPIWIALYGVLQNTFALRHAPFLWNLTWIHDLSQPDYLVRFTHPIPFLFGADIRGINLLPVLLAVAMAAQQQFMPKPMAASPEQMKQQQMMQWLSPVMFLFFFYGLPSGLNIYIFTSTAVGVVESKIIRDHLKQREEAEKAGKVFVETKPTRGSKKKDLMSRDEPPPRGGIAGWIGGKWAALLEQAEQAKRDQDRRKDGGNGRRR